MTRPDDHRLRTSDFRRLTLAVVAVFCAQVALAGHAFQHDDAGAADICGICAHLAELDAPPPAISLDLDAVGEVEWRVSASFGRVCSDGPSPFDARAPPRH